MKHSFRIPFNKTSRKGEFAPFHIGNVAVEFDCASITIDGHELPDNSIHYLIGYGLKQTLADAYAQLVTPEKAIPAWQEKLTNVLEGKYDFGEDGRGDPIKTEMRKLAEAAILGNKSRGAWVKANGENGEKLLVAKVNKVMEANADKLRAKATFIVAQRKADAMELDLGDDDDSTPAPVLIKAKKRA